MEQQTPNIFNNPCMEQPTADDDHYPGILPCKGRDDGLYPRVDISIWLRTCQEDTPNPVVGQRTGHIPEWLSGSLVQNGPGKFSFGADVYKHLFDGSALVQKFEVSGGEVTYQCKFVRTRAFKKNSEAAKIVVPEFGTAVKQKGLRKLKLSRDQVMSDNTMITVYPFNGSLYTFYESPFIHRLDTDLTTVAREDLSKLGMLSHASHPHFDRNGNMITLGLKLGLFGPKYSVSKFLKSDPCLALASKSSTLAEVSCSRMFHPGYMHSFSITESFIVLIEQPLTVSVMAMVSALLRGQSVSTALKWDSTESVIFHLVNKITGCHHPIKYVTKSFFFLHTINAYEDSDHVVVDICSYDSPAMMDCMFLDKLQSAQSNADYSKLFRGRPKRYVLPLKPVHPVSHNQVMLDYTSACAHNISTTMMAVEPDVICNEGCETPAINYEKSNGKKYRYFYAISSDVDADNAGKVMKIDTLTGGVTSWEEENTYCSEPVFVPSPNSVMEDDGVIISSIIWGKPHVNMAGVIFLNGQDFSLIARVHFSLPGPVPKPLHGCFLPSWQFKMDT